MSVLDRFFSRHQGYYAYLKFAVVVGGVLLAFALALAIYTVFTAGSAP